MYCANCGSEQKEGSNFCHVCDHQITQDENKKQDTSLNPSVETSLSNTKAPEFAMMWSLFLTPIIGAIFWTKNWNRLGKSQNIWWTWVSAAVVLIITIFSMKLFGNPFFGLFFDFAWIASLYILQRRLIPKDNKSIPAIIISGLLVAILLASAYSSNDINVFSKVASTISGPSNKKVPDDAKQLLDKQKMHAAQQQFSVNAENDPSQRNWLNTHIDVNKSEYYSITASGRASFDSHQDYTDPDGSLLNSNGVLQNKKRFDQSVLSSAPIGALIGAIQDSQGNISAPFELGSNVVIQIPSSGQLLLAYNDDPGGYSDNSGFYSVTVANSPSGRTSSGGSGTSSGITTVLFDRADPIQNSTITIEGSGLGQHPAYNGDSSYLQIHDVNSNWNAGYGNDRITLNVIQWTDNKIVINGFTGSYGGGWSINPGDKLLVGVLNPQSTSTTPAIYQMEIPSTGNSNSSSGLLGSNPASDGVAAHYFQSATIKTFPDGVRNVSEGSIDLLYLFPDGTFTEYEPNNKNEPASVEDQGTYTYANGQITFYGQLKNGISSWGPGQYYSSPKRIQFKYQYYDPSNGFRYQQEYTYSHQN